MFFDFSDMTQIQDTNTSTADLLWHLKDISALS